MSPSNVYLNTGDTVAITLILSGASEVHGVHLALAYDASVVQVIDANAGQPGVQILPGPFPAGTSPGTELQNSVSPGTITYQYVLSGAEEDDGTGTVATVQFLALANGSADFSWQTAQLVDASGVPTNAGSSVATLLVGAASPTPGITDTPTAIPVATDTPVALATDTAVPTITSTATLVPPTSTRTAAPTSTVTAMAGTPTATQTAKVTIVSTPQTGQPPRSGGLDPSQSDRAGGLPSAGSAKSGIAWWRWVFFMGALMFGIAGWFFTLAVYNGSKEVVLVDRFDRRRRRRR